MYVASEMSGTPSKIHINRRARRNERKKEAERICEEIMAEELPKSDESINLYI